MTPAEHGEREDLALVIVLLGCSDQKILLVNRRKTRVCLRVRDLLNPNAESVKAGSANVALASGTG